MAQPSARNSASSAIPLPVLTVTIKTAAEITGLSRSTLLRRADEGELRTILCHGRRLVHLESLKQMLGFNQHEGAL
jgi:excisionase family DNA binding protein